MAPHSSTLAWKIPWMEGPGGLQSMASLGVRHDWATSLSRIGEGNSNPLQCSCLENPRDGGAWWAAVSGVAQSRTRLTRLSSSSSNTGSLWNVWCTMREINSKFPSLDIFFSLDLCGNWRYKDNLLKYKNVRILEYLGGSEKNYQIG